jgi:hypothetical protein
VGGAHVRGRAGRSAAGRGPGADDAVQHSAGPPARALIDVAIDARRFRAARLPAAFLEHAAAGYLSGYERDQLDDDWLEHALAYASRPCKGTRGPLTRTRTTEPGGRESPAPQYRLADYLDQQGRRTRNEVNIPAQFWAAASELAPEDQFVLADPAHAQGRYRDGARLLKAAIAYGDPDAARLLVDFLNQLQPGDPRPAHWAASHVDPSNPYGALLLLESLHAVGADEAAAELITRVSHARPDLVSPGSDAWQPAYGRPQMPSQESVTARVRARYAGTAETVDLSDPFYVAVLLEAMQDAKADEEIAALVDCDPDEEIALLLARDPGAHVDVRKPNSTYLLSMLREVGADEQAAALARRIADDVDLSEPRALSSVIDSLRGTDEAMAVLVARDPAAHTDLRRSDRFPYLLDSLVALGASDQVATLLARNPAAHVKLVAQSVEGGGVLVESKPESAGVLLPSLRKAGADEQAATLAARMIGAGAFQAVIAHSEDPVRFCFGREANGDPAAPWNWDDLD